MTKKYRGPKDAKIRLDRERLRAERVKRGLTIEKLAYESDDRFSPSTYKRAEGGREISVLMAQEIAAALGADLADLVAKVIAEEEPPAEDAQPVEESAAAEQAPPAEEPAEPQPDSQSETPPPEPPPTDQERINTRYVFFQKAALMFVNRYRDNYNAKLVLNEDALYKACVDYFRAADDVKRHSVIDSRLSPLKIGALTSYALVRNRPILAVEMEGSFLSEDQRAVHRYANEMMALSIGASIARVDIAESMMVLIEMLAHGIDELNFYLAFRLLKRKPPGAY